MDENGVSGNIVTGDADAAAAAADADAAAAATTFDAGARFFITVNLFIIYLFM
jgi:hypothetical protein